MREIKFRCWFDNQMHKVEDISFKGKKTYQELSQINKIAQLLTNKDIKLIIKPSLNDGLT